MTLTFGPLHHTTLGFERIFHDMEKMLDNNISKLKALEPKLTFLKTETNDEELSDLWEPDERRCNGKINIVLSLVFLNLRTVNLKTACTLYRPRVNFLSNIHL